jgi:hypothetical protein
MGGQSHSHHNQGIGNTAMTDNQKKDPSAPYVIPLSTGRAWAYIHDGSMRIEAEGRIDYHELQTQINELWQQLPDDDREQLPQKEPDQSAYLSESESREWSDSQIVDAISRFYHQLYDSTFDADLAKSITEIHAAALYGMSQSE